MGFCSGTDLFDPMVKFILNSSQSEDEKVEAIKVLITALEDMDWDCQYDSAYIDNPIVDKAFVALHPDWHEDEDAATDMDKITSKDGKLFYIHEIAITKGKMIYAGWLSKTSDDWYPFNSYEIKDDGYPQQATKEEIERYQKRFDEISAPRT